MITLLWGAPALAEDISDLGGHGLVPATQLFVDLLDPAESITWSGVITEPGGAMVNASIQLFAPDGTALGTFPSGSTIPASAGVGAYRVDIVGIGDLDGQNGDEPLTAWSLAVPGADPSRGRVWSRRWVLNGGGFGEPNGLDDRFFAVVGGGAVYRSGVVELRTEGLTGFVYAVLGNAVGVTGANARSVPEAFGSISDRVPLYLRPPAVVSPDVLAPTLSGVQLTVPSCGAVSPGVVQGELAFDSDVTGAWHLVCDADGDLDFDPTSPGDVHGFGVVGIGTNVVAVSGTFPNGSDAPAGTYLCQLWLTVGDFHYLAQDIETSYPGFRMFEVDDALVRTGLPMFWDDRAVQSAAVPMPDGALSLQSSGPDGLPSGADVDVAVPNGNARAWGDFTTNTKGNANVLDTWTFLARDVSAPFELSVLDPTEDADADALPDASESCVYGTSTSLVDTDGDGLSDALEALQLPTDPLLVDSDGDGLSDGEEVPDPSQPRDTDADGLIDAVDPDDDDDGVPTAIEGVGDFDEDGRPDHLDRDDDDDTVLTIAESSGDTDGDGFPDRLDDDDDGDGIPTALEDIDLDANPLDDDTDDDGTPDFLDDDDDDDGILSRDELPVDSDGDGITDRLDDDDDGDTVPTAFEGDGNTDGDTLPDYLDTDDDADGILTRDEDADGDGDPTDDDADGDGTPDFQEIDDDGDGRLTPTEDLDGDGDPFDDDTDGDGLSNHRDPDDDGDGVPSAQESGDTDDDGLPDHLDPDDDDDGVPTRLELPGDADDDGLPNHRDTDSDDDGVPDGEERDGDTDDDGLPDRIDPDDDGDGVPTAQEGSVDTDQDGLLDRLDPDDDDDGVPTEDEFDGDTDGDMLVDRLDPDDDDDGLPTADELWDGDPDVDGDGLPNWRDPDADGDGVPDGVEGTADLDGDGIPDFLDADGALAVFYRGSGLGCRSVPGASWLGLLALLGLRRRR